MTDFNYEMAELDSLSNYSPYKVKIYDAAGNSTKWLTVKPETFVVIRDALVAQGNDTE
jgi:hypothetical protein